MAVTTNNVNLELRKYRKKLAVAFLRNNRLDAYTGSSVNSPIQRVADLEAGGKQVYIPLLDQLRSQGVSVGQLNGREEALDSYGMPMWPAWRRNAVVFRKDIKKESAIQIRDQATPALAGWTRRIRRDDAVDVLVSIPTASEQSGRMSDPGNSINGLRWKDANASQRNLWATANSDRILYGSLAGNMVSGNVAASLANVTAVSGRDRMSAAIGSLAKRTAQSTTALASWPAITPWQVEDTDEEWYLCLLGSRGFRDLQADPVMAQANRDARSRESGDPTKTNPIFTGGALVYGGVIYREIPEITPIYVGTASTPGPFYGAGAAGVDVEPFVLLGASAYAYVIGQMPKPTHRDETDYQFNEGIGTEMQYGYGKIAKAPTGSAGQIGDLKDWGVVTGFVAAPADA
jgi:hypothetical protein